jgi:hypothetical protein
MTGLATITLSTSSVRAEETTALEVGKRDSTRRYQRVLFLRVNGRGAEEDEHCRDSRNREPAFPHHELIPSR